MPHTATLAEVARLCRSAQCILFITGAGLSADSGLPTYRGVSGLYEDRLTEEDIPIETALSGQMLPEDAMLQLESTLEEGVDLVISVGTTSVFPYIAGPLIWAREVGIPTVEINPGDTRVSEIVDFRLRMGTAEALSGIWRQLGLACDPDPLAE